MSRDKKGESKARDDLAEERITVIAYLGYRGEETPSQYNTRN